MSVHVMSHVWKHSTYSGSELLTLLALADWADDDGVCWPSIKKLAAKSRQSDRSVQSAIRKFQKDGVLSINERVNTSSVYRIDLSKISGAEISPGEKQPDKLPSRGEILAPNTSDIRNYPSSTPSASDALMAGGNNGLHHEVETTIKQEYERVNKIKCPWDVSEGAALKKLLKSNPSWNLAIIRKMVMNRFLSDGVNGERPRIFIPHLSRWAAGPLDRYGKVKEQKAAEQFNLTGGYEQVMANRRANGFH